MVFLLFEIDFPFISFSSDGHGYDFQNYVK